ncbi:MAG: hypothetical protein PHY47_00535 [Lachnospiraceae bacterium]|nr:hypothetical protein [Lachnospiraceae bacterium]
MKLSKKEKLFIDHSVKPIEEDACTRFRDIKIKEEKTMLTIIRNNLENIVLGLICVMAISYTVDNINMSQAEDNYITHVVNDRSPAVVEMYMSNK